MKGLVLLISRLAQIKNPLPEVPVGPGILGRILQFVFALAGAICLLVIVISGLRFAMSQGDPQNTNKARNAIIYALVGLVIAILASAIVNFVVLRVG